MPAWYELKDPNQVDSPALVVYKKRIEQNINFMTRIVGGDTSRLIPHVKTHKMAEVVKMQLAAGISKFKCATIAEAEMLAQAGAKWVLIAYQLTGPKIDRMLELIKAYPDVQFGSLIDDRNVAKHLNDYIKGKKASWLIFVDVNVGMNRTGHAVNSDLLNLYEYVYKLPNLLLAGIHVYDGHIREKFFKDRKVQADQALEQLAVLYEFIEINGLPDPFVIAGGTPTFTVHALRKGVYCSPGTCLFWDAGYGDQFREQPFVYAALVLTRVISKPASGTITLDLGHKAIAAENPIDKRFRLLNLPDAELVSQSEEHAVVKVSNWDSISIGDVYYAVPYHICPTVALHGYASVVEDGEVSEVWEVTARNRKIVH
ncbi:D-TA family PLP-dependent enzyme [Ravibacter arvi]|uniref:D-TA family PLP-dependent enzyme n=1 Tax=Ravibacter arvi TaxID=2051041 RepID=A0ABP8LN25_9BACT